MKKTLKGLALILIAGLILVSLAGCGSNKLVATKTTNDENIGNYKEEIVVEFKKDKIDNVQITSEYDKEETANSAYSLYNMMFSMSEEDTEGIEVKQDGKKLIVKMSSEAFAKSENMSDEDMSKDALKAELEKEGYTVK